MFLFRCIAIKGDSWRCEYDATVSSCKICQELCSGECIDRSECTKTTPGLKMMQGECTVDSTSNYQCKICDYPTSEPTSGAPTTALSTTDIKVNISTSNYAVISTTIDEISTTDNNDVADDPTLAGRPNMMEVMSTVAFVWEIFGWI